jgi:hypothetical protein
VGKSRFRVVSTRNTKFIRVLLLLLFIYYCIIYLYYLSSYFYASHYYYYYYYYYYFVSLLMIYFFNTNNCKPTFAHPCIYFYNLNGKIENIQGVFKFVSYFRIYFKAFFTVRYLKWRWIRFSAIALLRLFEIQDFCRRVKLFYE